jgi:hypothetical protein
MPQKKEMFVSGNGPRILELMDELKGSVGHEVITALESLGWTVYTFQANHRDLKTLLEFVETDPRGDDLFLPLRHRDKLHEALREIIRRLHNFAASAKSLEDHTRVLRKHMHQRPSERMHRDLELDEETQGRIDKLFIQDRLAQFVQQLRDYAVHRGLPGAEFRMSQQKGGPIVKQVRLPVQQLVVGWDWNTRSKAYMESCGQSVPLLETIEEYERRTREFYVWFEDHYRELYASEIEEYRSKEWELAILQVEDALAMHPGIAKHASFVPRRDEVFVNVLSSDEFDDLESVPDGPGRGAKAIDILRRHGEVPEHIERAIGALYAEAIPAPPEAAPLREGQREFRRTVQGETVRITDLLDDSVGDVVEDILFQGCEIVGPAVVVPIATEFDDCTWGTVGTDSDALFWELREGRQALDGAIGLRRCRFERCNFTRVGVAGTAAYLSGWTLRG